MHDFSHFSSVPIQALPFEGVQASMLRLDMLHPLVSGNKWLKLTVWLEKFNAGNYAGILTKGGPWSNHLHACAHYCHLAGIPMHAIVKAPPHTSTATLQDLRHLGCSLTFVHRQQYYDETAWQQEAHNRKLLYIPMGGEGPEGITGVANWIKNRLAKDTWNTLMVSLGTGTTLIGIAHSGIACRQLIGIDPGTGDKSLESKIMQETAHFAGTVVCKMHPGKFGKGGEDRVQFMKNWHAQTDIELDWVYTAPLCIEFTKMLTNRQFEENERVLLIHTGGLQGNRSQDLQPAQPLAP